MDDLLSSELPDFTEIEKCLQKRRVLSLSLACHCLSYLREALDQECIQNSGELSRMASGQVVRATGVVVRPHRPPTKSGRTVVFFTLEDEFGLVDVTVFQEICRKYGALVYTRPALIVEGKLERRGAYLSVIAHRLWPLAGRPRSQPAGVRSPKEAR